MVSLNTPEFETSNVSGSHMEAVRDELQTQVMVQRSRISAGLCGIAGEYFVAAELTRRGYIASLTLRNTRGVDILASNLNATRSVGIQVKALQGISKAWMLNRRVGTGRAMQPPSWAPN